MRPVARLFSGMLIAIGLCACGDRSEPPVVEAPPPPPEPTISLEEQQEQQAIAAAKGLFEYIPKDFTVVVGMRPRAFAEAGSSKQDAREAETVTAMLKRSGFDPDKVEQVFAGSRGGGEEVLVALRVGGSLDEDGIKEKLVLTSDEKVEDRQVYALTNDDAHENGLCFLDRRTVLLGRLSSVKRALREKGENEKTPLRQAQRDLGKASAPFWISVTEGLAKKVMAESLVPGLDSSEYSTAKGFAMTVSQKTDPITGLGTKSVQAVFTFDRPTQAANFAKSIEAGIEAHQTVLLDAAKGRKEIRSRAAPPEEAADEPSGTGDSGAMAGEPGDPGIAADASGSSGTRTSGRKSSDSKDDKTYEDSIVADGNLVRVKLNYEDARMGPAISKAIGLARGATPIDDGIFPGPLARLSESFSELWERKGADLQGVTPGGNPDDPKFLQYSWMCQLLPHLGYYFIYDNLDFDKSWTDDNNYRLTKHRIAEFLNPAASHDQWQGYPLAGMGLTHFVGMAGVEEGRNDLAADYPREDPRAGIFGYDRILRSDEVTDGLGQTILMIGAEGVAGPWVQGGGSTIRGAREPFFDERTGFGSAGIPGGGAYVLMADGSMRIVSKDIDPEVFKAMCTARGGESVDLGALRSAR